VAGDSKVVATCSTKVSSTGVNPIHPYNVGTPSPPGWAVTQHGTANVPISVSVANNISPSACGLVVTSCNSGGCISSGSVNSGTLASVATTAIWFKRAGSVQKPNDVWDGRNGTFLNANCYSEGDTQYFTWASDGNHYGIGQNSWGWNNSFAAQIQFVNWNKDHSCATGGMSSGNNKYGIQATTYQPSMMPPLSIQNILYEGSYSNASGNCCFNILKWPNDNWSTSINAQHNTGPGASAVSGVDLPVGVFGMNADNSPLLLFAVLPFCQSWGGNSGQFPCSWQAGMDGWVPFIILGGIVSNPFLGECRVEDFITGNFWTRSCRVYKGTQTGDDGLYDTAWDVMSNYAASAIKLVGDATSSDPYNAAYQTAGVKYSIQAFPDASRFILSIPITLSNPASSSGIAMYDLGQWFWGKPSGPIGQISRDVAKDPFFQPGFPQWVQSSYRTITNAATLSGYATIATSGEDEFKGTTAVGVQPTQGNDGSASRNIPMQWTAGTQTFPQSDITSPAPLVNYDFQGFSGSTGIVDRSGNGFSSTCTLINSFDNFGWINGGFPTTLNNLANQPMQYLGRENKSCGLPFNTVQSSFTLFYCFGHVPGGPINPAASGEIALSDSSINVSRSGSSQSWSVTFKTLSGTVVITDGTVGCVVIDRDGSNVVNIYTDDQIRPVPPLTPTIGPSTIAATWTPGLFIGNGSNSLYGAHSKLIIYPHLTAEQMIQEMNAIRKDLQARRIPIQ
jgi:hypothetical protein